MSNKKKNEPIEDPEERKLIQSAYRRLLRGIPVTMTPEDKKQIKMAYIMAVEAHNTQRRKTGEPYILHPIEVARICAVEMGLGVRAITAALLHDVVEDTDITLKEINEQFGPKIAMIVDGLTKINKAVKRNEEEEKAGDMEDEMPQFDPKMLQVENLRKVLLTLAKDVRVVMIKIADRLHNMRTIGSMKYEKQLRIASETTYVYAPLAHRLGLFQIKTELEDLALKIRDPEAFDYVTQKLEATEKDRNAYIRKFIAPIKDQLDTLDFAYKIHHRVKSVNSIANKVKKKEIPFEEIYDIFAIRVVVDVAKEREKSACWNVYSTITDHYVPVPERLKDWISLPKPNGYESLHITVMGPQGRFVEVQIRSQRMEEVADRGLAAHWKYKGGPQDKDKDNVLDRWLDQAREVLDSRDGDALDFLNDFKTNLFDEAVYVFTPKGEMKMMPRNATALDFAFEIHTKVGYHCKAIKANGRIVPMSYILKNGDQLEIITHPQQKPNEDWLKIVVTGRARAKIRQSLKDEEKQRSEVGRESVERKLKNMKLDFDTNVDVLVKHYGFANRLELYFAATLEKIDLNDIKKLAVENGKLQLEVPASVPAEPRSDDGVMEMNRRREFKGKPKLLIDGEDASDYNYVLSTCCNPVQGDEVFAYVSGKSGMKIHRTTCPNAEHMQATWGYRIKRAEWVDSMETSFVAHLRITGMDDLGVVYGLTNTITKQLNINMREISLKGDEGYFEGNVGVVINHRDQLNLLIKTLKEIPGVNSVSRIEENPSS